MYIIFFKISIFCCHPKNNVFHLCLLVLEIKFCCFLYTGVGDLYKPGVRNLTLEMNTRAAAQNKIILKYTRILTNY